MIVRNTKPDENRRVNELFAIAFELPVDDGPADPENDRVHHWAAFEDDTNNMMSTFTISDYQINFDHHSCKMGGIGGVASLPQYRRHGGIRCCFEAALPDMYANQYDFSYLYPFSTAYYRKFGYECCVEKLQITLLLELLKVAPIEGTFRLAEAHNTMRDAIKSIDQVWEHKYNMMVLHEDEDYDWTDKFDPAVKQEFTYVYFDKNNVPKSYTTFKKMDQPDGRNLVCSRFSFVDKEGFYGLMALLKSLAADHKFAKFPLPHLSSFEYLFPEWSMGAMTHTFQNAGMVRVINVENVLKKASYKGTGSISIQINDKQISENNNCYTVYFENGKASKVVCNQDDADIILDISTFSALIAGVSDFDDAKDWLSGIEVKHENACFSSVFYRKKMMIADYF